MMYKIHILTKCSFNKYNILFDYIKFTLYYLNYKYIYTEI